MEFTWIITAILGLLIIYLFYLLVNKNMDYWPKLGVPQQQTVPFFGNALQMALGRQTISEAMKQSYKYFEGHKYYGFMIFQKPNLVIRDPELINQVFVKNFSHFQDRTLPTPEDSDLNNAGLPGLTGHKWRVLRHKLTPTFTSGKLKIMFNQMKECSEELVHYLSDKTGEDIESRNLMFKFIINVIGSISFGIKVDALNDESLNDNDFYRNSVNFFKPSLATQIKLLILLTSPKIKEIFNLKMVDEKVTNFFEKLTQDMIKLREKDNVKRNDFLQLMIEQKKIEEKLISNESKQNKSLESNVAAADTDEPEDNELLNLLKEVQCDKDVVVFTDRIIAAQAFVFISGGSETVAAILSFTLYELALNKDAQKQLQDEIDTVLTSQDLNYESIKKMTYMDQVLNEVMRLRPPGGVLGRMCTEDYKLPGTDIVINKGTTVQVPVIGLHYDPEYFPNPDKFDPDRFQNMETIPKGVFFPFGGGPRMCIAMRLAMLEMKVLLATLLSSYNVTLSSKTQTPLRMNKTSILQHVVGGIWVRFESRNK